MLFRSEMNGPGQKFVDSLEAPELAPYVADFQNGALWLYGHTLMARAARMGVVGDWAERYFAGDRAKSNAFYLQVGGVARPGEQASAAIRAIGADMTPGQVLAVFA